MATTISPAIGAGALFTQQGQGTSPGYSAIDLRRSDSLGLQEGVYGASDFMVVQKGSGANLSVDITMPAGGFACVQGDSVSGQGLYTVPVHNVTVNEVVAAADATNPRIDSVILEVLDNVHDASGSSLARVRVLTGTPNGTADLNTRAGAPTLPANALLLADLRVTALATTVDNTKIRDRRKFARGAYVRILRTSNAAAGNDYTTTSGTAAAIDAANLSPRVECSGVPLRITLNAPFGHSTAETPIILDFAADGTPMDGDINGKTVRPNTAASDNYYSLQWDTVPSAASHVLAPRWRVALATATMFARATIPAELVIEEIVRQNTANNATTTG